MAKNTGSIREIRKKVTSTHECISTAYHEAGHAVFGLLSGVQVPSVCVFQNKKSKRWDGFTHYNSIDLTEVEDAALLSQLLDIEIGIKYAGLVAERYHFKRISGSDKFPFYWKDGSSDDTKTAAELIKKYSTIPAGRKRYAYKQKIIRQDFAALQLYWDSVTLVAHALFHKKKLYFEDLKRILTKKSEDKNFWKTQFKEIENIFDSPQS
jgi:hypothetical protein